MKRFLAAFAPLRIETPIAVDVRRGLDHGDRMHLN